ncbi:MAG: DUF1385 domain-containing protein [Clostridiales bacterium]|nr:DUF1385 domain-containing protein [Clostridiales bacterium]
MNNKTVHKTSIGGQALIEGILMRGPKGNAMALRMPDGSIQTEYKNYTFLKDKYKILGWPFIRGVVNFIESMIIGYKALIESAEKTMNLEDEEANAENMSKFDIWLNNHFGEKMVSAISAIAMVLGFAVAFFLFFWLPTFSANIINKLAGGNLHNYLALFEGIMRIIIFVGYIAIVSNMKDIKRVFMYHGAEHKSIFCYENGLELTVENVRKQKRFHPRCGTSFIFIVLIISILLSSIISISFPTLRTTSIALWIAVKILLLPFVTGISYEFIKYAGRHDNILTKIFSAPGLWMQRLTVKEPTDDIIEVGIASIKAVMTDNPEDDEIK